MHHVGFSLFQIYSKFQRGGEIEIEAKKKSQVGKIIHPQKPWYKIKIFNRIATCTTPKHNTHSAKPAFFLREALRFEMEIFWHAAVYISNLWMSTRRPYANICSITSVLLSSRLNDMQLSSIMDERSTDGANLPGEEKVVLLLFKVTRAALAEDLRLISQAWLPIIVVISGVVDSRDVS